MLREIANARQVAGEPRRRWFYSAKCDLIVWLDDGDSIVGFQFCYDKGDDEHALTWKPSETYAHTSIDSGERHPLRAKESPIHVSDGSFDAGRVAELFKAESAEVPYAYADLVIRKIVEYGRSLAA